MAVAGWVFGVVANARNSKGFFEGEREWPVGLPSALEKAPSPFFRVAWAHGGGVASGVANVHEHPEARERWLAVQRLAVTLSDREVPVVN